MNVNFFTWMREGVKQAVLMGVSDAVEEIGLPSSGDEANQNLLATLQNPAITESKPVAAAAARGGRKRLGRSLKDVGPQEKAA